MRTLTLVETLFLHQKIISNFGGSLGVRDIDALESALAQPHASFGGEELYPGIISKAASLCFSLVLNHPFVDGNKRIGHAAMETFLLLNGYEIVTDIDEEERVMLDLAAGQISRLEFTSWLAEHTRQITTT